MAPLVWAFVPRGGGRFDARGWKGVRHTCALTLNKEFRRAYYRGRNVSTPLVTVYAVKNRERQTRLGLTATKKIGKAVQRNRARRVMKEAYRLMEDQFPLGWDFVLVARAKTVKATTPQVMGALEFALRKLFKSV